MTQHEIYKFLQSIDLTYYTDLAVSKFQKIANDPDSFCDENVQELVEYHRSTVEDDCVSAGETLKKMYRAEDEILTMIKHLQEAEAVNHANI